MTEDKLREKVHSYIDQVDEGTLRMIYAMLKEYSSQYEISDGDLAEAERRMEEHKAGKGKWYTVEEAKVEIRRRTGRKK